MNMQHKAVPAALGLLCFISVAAYGNDTNLIPEIHGTLRTRYEVATENGDMRFQVRNARIGVTGNICNIVDYKAETDICDLGKMKFLDVWGRVSFGHNWKVQLGNMRMPFTMGSYRAPHQYFFADRPTTDKQVGSPRNVGLKIIYNAKSLPISVEGGVFNSLSNTSQSTWQSRMSAATKVRYILDQVTFLTGFQTLAPDTVRINHVSGAISWQNARWLVEGEYVYRHYTHNKLSPTHAYNFMVDYGIPVKLSCFNRVSFQGRWDGLTDCSDGESIGNGEIAVTSPAFNRITIGTTVSYIHEKVRADFRLNYESYIHHDGVKSPNNERSKLVAELVVRF